MAVLPRMTGRRRSVASVSSVSAFSTILVALAIANPGLTSADVELNDSGIWVTRSDQMQVGRFNHAAQVVDGSLTSGSPTFDVHQQGDAVLVYNQAAWTLSTVDTATLNPASPAHVPEGAAVSMGGPTVAIFDESEGTLWVLPFTDVGSFSTEQTEPVIEGVAGDGGVAVGLDGTVYLATPGDATLRTVPTADGVPLAGSSRELEDVSADDILLVTAVGTKAVVLDRTSGDVYLPDARVTIDEPDDARLQRPGPDRDTVLIATTGALLTQPLSGGDAAVAGKGGSAPAAPVLVGQCAYAAWTGSGNVRRDCPGDGDDYDKTVPVPTGGGLRFRVNRGAVVLNELSAGTVWLADQDLERFDNWDEALAANDVDEDESEASTEQSRDPLQDRNLPNRPPVAKDDAFGVRPGSTTVLPVLHNDADPDGDVLTATVQGAGPSFGEVQSIYDGTGLQIVVPDGATGDTSFEYRADDGREGGTDSATVTVSVHEESVNGPPKRTRPTSVDVEQGGTIDIRALDDWIDPDGDALLLVAASVDTDDEVRFRADGLLTFVDKNLTQGVKKISITVSDGRGGETTDEITVTVHPSGDIAPDTKADHVTAVVDRAVTVLPLANDVDANGDQLQLARVDAEEAISRGAQVEANLAAGSFSFRASSPGVYYLTYLVTDGLHPVLGLVRVDVIESVASDKPPVAVLDTALLPAEGAVLVDVLANDSDPSGGVLVVQTVEIDPQAGISVSVINHQILRISAIRDLAGQQVRLGYRVSNGVASAAGQVLVIPLPRPERYQAPVAVADTATVRVGDVVTIPVLENDSHPDGLPFTLVRDLVEPLDDETAGMIFTTDGAVRFRAGDTPTTVHALYEIVDSKGTRSSAQITITIRAMDEEHNSAPRPVSVTARVLAGSTVRIAIPLDGIDPDGDSVRLIGLRSAPEQGSVTAFGDGWLDYRASRGANGTDTFEYVVADSVGAQKEGAITVGIAPPPDQNLAPVALPDLVTVQPGRDVAVAVMTNDTDPEGAQLQLIRGAIEGPDAETLQADVDHDRVTVRTPDQAGSYSLTYTVQDELLQKATATLTVQVQRDAPRAAPIARDDLLTLSDVAGQEAVLVPVLDNDVDPDGATSALELALSVAHDGASVVGRQVKVVVTAEPQMVAYTVTDPDGQTARAFVRVPGLAELRPSLRPGLDPLEVEAGQTESIDLRDWVLVADGKTVRITDPNTLRAVQGRAEMTDERHLDFTAAESYSGPASVTVEVIDTERVDDPTGLRALVTVPITVTNAAVPPDFADLTVSVAAGEDAVVTPLAPHVTVQDGGDARGLRFEITQGAPDGFTAALDGQDLQVSAQAAVPTGTTGEMTVSVSDGRNDPVEARVALVVVPSTAPRATTNTDVVADAHQGEPVRVAVLENDVSPFADAPLELLPQVVVETAGAGDARVDGSEVVVTPAGSYHGTMVVRYRVADKTGDPAREVDGRIELSVKGAPEAPGAPVVAEIRSHTVVLTWTAPADNGAPVKGYTVTSTSGPPYSKACLSTTCTLDNLTNDQEYTFQVVATNEVDDSPPSPSSGVARPDERPDPPAAPTLEFGDTTLTVRWTNQDYSDRSQIASVNLQISPAPSSGVTEVHDLTTTEYPWSGLANGTGYQVRVQAVNKADTPSDWGAWSAVEIPAGKPDAPGIPVTSAPQQVGSRAQMNVTWTAPADNGDAVSQYTVRVFRGGAEVSQPQTVPGGTTTTQVTQDVSDVPYTVTVSATNKAGEGVQSAPSAPRQLVNPPGPVGGVLKAYDQDGAAQLEFSAAAGNGASPSQIRYQYSLNGGGWNNLAADKRVTGLANNAVYTIGVRAVSTVDGAEYAGPSQSVGNVAPFGLPGTPSVSATPGATTVRLCWSPPGANGRPIHVEISIDGGGRENVGTASSCRDVGNDYDQPHSITAWAIDSEGITGQAASASARSGLRPAPTATVAKVNGQPVVTVTNFTANRYEVRCWNDAPAGYSWDNFIGASSYNVPSNGSFIPNCGGQPIPSGEFTVEIYTSMWTNTIAW